MGGVVEQVGPTNQVGGADLTVGYQPTVDLLTGSCTGYEAMPSWRRAVGSPLAGEGFWIFAERYGHGASACEVVVRAVVADLAAARRRGFDTGVRMPVLVQHAASPGCADQLVEHCRAADVPVQRLTVQLVRQAAVAPSAVMLATAALHRAGVRVALADVGANFGIDPLLQLEGLSEFTVSAFLTRRLPANEVALTEITQLLAIAEELKLDAVVDGVESRAQLMLLRQVAARRAQGLLWGPAHPMEEALRIGGLPQPRERSRV